MIRIIVLGNKGMLGHVVQKYLLEQNKYEIFGLNRNDLDMKNFTELGKIISTIKPDYIINCVGILNSGTNIQEFADINIALPRYLAHYTQDRLRRNKTFPGLNVPKVIHISTNCVFKDIGPHEAKDKPDATDLYGSSKAFGEIDDNHNLTIRTSIIGPELKKNGCGLMAWVFRQKGKTIDGYKNAMWNGVTTFHLAKHIEDLINSDKFETGIKNYNSDRIISKDCLLELINKIYGLNINVIITEIKGIHSSLLRGVGTLVPYEDQLKDLKEWYKGGK